MDVNGADMSMTNHTLRDEPLALWEKLADVPIDKNECIEEGFEQFPVGTCRQEIWHWMESQFGVRVFDLMFTE